MRTIIFFSKREVEGFWAGVQTLQEEKNVFNVKKTLELSTIIFLQVNKYNFHLFRHLLINNSKNIIKSFWYKFQKQVVDLKKKKKKFLKQLKDFSQNFLEKKIARLPTHNVYKFVGIN